MSAERRRRRAERRAERRDPNIVVTVGTRQHWKEKPAIVRPPQFEDLAPYGADMRQALAEGFEAGLAEPVILAIHCNSDYARRQAEPQGEPMVFRAIEIAEAVRTGLVDGRCDYPPLPVYVVLLATGPDVQLHLATDLGEDALKLGWRYSPAARASVRSHSPQLADLLQSMVPIVR